LSSERRNYRAHSSNVCYVKSLFVFFHDMGLCESNQLVAAAAATSGCSFSTASPNVERLHTRRCSGAIAGVIMILPLLPLNDE
jgi:hypothetical protein